VTTSAAASAPAVRRFASDALIRRLAYLLLAFGIACGFAGVLNTIGAATQAKAFVTVTVKARTTAGLIVNSSPYDAGPSLTLRGDDYDTGSPPIRIDLPQRPVSGASTSGHYLEADTGALKLSAWDSTVVEQLLSHVGAVVGLSVFSGTLLLRRLLLSIAEGEPFRPGNARRIAILAALFAGCGTVMSLAPGLAADVVLSRLGLNGPDSPVTASYGVPVTAFAIAALLLVLAEAFRRGTELARDVDGLV
jgi:hypothetical protein